MFTSKAYFYMYKKTSWIKHTGDILRLQFYLLYVNLFGSQIAVKLCLEGINYITFIEIFLRKLMILKSKSSKPTHQELPLSPRRSDGFRNLSASENYLNRRTFL